MDTAVGTAAAEQRTGGGARPDAPAHARPGAVHWAVVAAGCAALVAGALAANPANGTTAPLHPVPRALPAAEAPDPAQAELPLDCGPFPVKISVQFAAALGDGRPGTVAAAHCDAGNGTPPDAVYLLGPGADGRPEILATLLSDQENLTVDRLALRSDGVITGHARGYSSEDVPRFSPDVSLDLTWSRQGGRWVRAQQAVAPSIQV